MVGLSAVHEDLVDETVQILAQVICEEEVRHFTEFWPSYTVNLEGINA